MPAGKDWERNIDTSLNNQETGSYILSYNLQTYIPVPAAGAVPVKRVANREDMDITVVWKDGDGGTLGDSFNTFSQDVVYQADIKLTAKEGFSFNPAVSFKYPDGAVAAQPADNSSAGVRSLSPVTYHPAAASTPDTPIESVNLTNYIPAPVTGAAPVTSFTAETYRGTVVWTTGGGTAAPLFEEGAVYKAAVSLYPAAGYSFPASVPVTHGGGAVAAFTGEPRQGTITFPVTSLLAFFSGPFSGSSAAGTGDMDSAVDLIKAAREADHPSLYLQLAPRTTEEVGLTTANRDITGGLVLKHENLAADTSPAFVTIDGGKRVIQMTDSGTLITVGPGVTLTLRNITLRGSGQNTAPIVKEDGGTLILETGVSIMEDAKVSFSGFTTKADSAVDEIRDAYNSDDPLEIKLSPGTEVVDLNGNSDLGAGLVLDSTNSPASVTIDGQERTVRLDANSAGGSLITVGAGVTLTLKNITLAGKDGNNAALVRVEAGGTLILEDGAVIRDNKNTAGNGGGVAVGVGGTLTMEGGTINGNADYEVYVDKDGAVVKTGGIIGGNGSGGLKVDGRGAAGVLGSDNDYSYPDP
jgi:hypothetical protein